MKLHAKKIFFLLRHPASSSPLGQSFTLLHLAHVVTHCLSAMQRNESGSLQESVLNLPN